MNCVECGKELSPRSYSETCSIGCDFDRDHRISKEIAAKFKHKCPHCNAAVFFRSSCPGYGGHDGKPVMVCWPPSSCGNAIEYKCTYCEWEWQDNLNEKSSRYEKNQKNKPSWSDAVKILVEKDDE